MSSSNLLEVGRVVHYYNRIGVAIVDVKAPIRVGDKIRIKGVTTDFTQVVESMEIEHAKISEAKPGDTIGLKVVDRVREKDVVYKVLEE